MIYISKDRQIHVVWSIFRGTSDVHEDFSRALVKVFLIGNYEKYLLEAVAEGGNLVFDIPQGLPEGAYSLEAIWVKNYNNLLPCSDSLTPSVDSGCRNQPLRWPFKHPHDHRFNDRCIMRSRKDFVFALTEYDSESTFYKDSGEAEIKIRSAVATYGYDGLSAYEIAVLRGDFNGTEGEYLDSLKFKLEVAQEHKLGGITAVTKTDDETEEVKVDPETGRLYVKPGGGGSLSVATETKLGGIKAAAKTNNETVEVKIGSDGKLYVPKGGEELNTATETTLGGIKAATKTSLETQEVKIDPVTGKLYTQPGGAGGVEIVNNPDEEDLHSVEQSADVHVLQFADKEYNASAFSGLGRVYLRKNISGGKNVLTQAMMNKANTRYIIQYDYDLDGGTITVPEGCILEFEGGSLKNGTIDGNRCKICSVIQYSIFNDCKIENFNISCIDIRWFGAVPNFVSTENSGVDNALYIERALEASMNHAGIPLIIDGCYKISSTITTKCDINLVGNYHNNRTFFSDSTIPDYTNPTSLLYVDDCIAFKMVGRGTDTQKNNNISIRNLYLKGSGSNSNSVFIEYSATGAPSRVGYISEVEVRGFNKFLYLYDDGSNQYGTLYGNLTIEKVVAYYNNQFIVTKASGNLVPTLCNLVIKDSNIEQNGERAIDLENLFGASIIDNCILEGQEYPIKAVIINGSLEITNNYFEGNDGDYLVNISGKSANNCFVKYENNYKHNKVTSPLRFSGITLTSFNSMYNNPSQLSFTDCIIACDIFQYLTTDSFTNTLNFNEPRYCDAINLNAVDLDENIRLLSFGSKRIESNILGTAVNSDRLYLVGTIANFEVNEGDVLVFVFYKTYGNFQFGVYNSSGAPIASNNGIVISGSSKMVMIKSNINASSSGIYVYMQATSGNPCIGNGMVYKNPDAVRLHKLGIFPAGLLSNAISPIYAQASNIGCNYFINTSRQTRGLYYSDNTDIRNSDGAPFSKEEIVPDFIQYYSFLRANKTYKVVGDLDLNGTQVIVPEGCTIDFSRGGTISNGMLSLTNTRLLPQGLNLREYILEGVSITGTYKDGQLVYDPTLKKMKLWNGYTWMNLDGTALE